MLELRAAAASSPRRSVGFARGGGSEVALACDMRFATLGKAVFGQPEIGLGMNMSWQSIPRMLHLMGPARTKQAVILADQRRYKWLINGKVRKAGDFARWREKLMKMERIDIDTRLLLIWLAIDPGKVQKEFNDACRRKCDAGGSAFKSRTAQG